MSRKTNGEPRLAKTVQNDSDISNLLKERVSMGINGMSTSRLESMALADGKDGFKIYYNKNLYCMMPGRFDR